VRRYLAVLATACRAPPRQTGKSELIMAGHLVADTARRENKNLTPSRKKAALQTAASAGNRGLVEVLLAHGADPNGDAESAGNAVFAAKTPELRALLMAHGGKLDPYELVFMDQDDEVMRRVTEDPSSAERGCGGVFTAVCTLAKRELLMRLLDAGFRVPPVLTACRSEVAEILRKHGAER
jgi:hypothetical protein